MFCFYFNNNNNNNTSTFDEKISEIFFHARTHVNAHYGIMFSTRPGGSVEVYTESDTGPVRRSRTVFASNTLF